MSRHHKPRAFWRLARIWFRHVRITVWLLLLLLLVILLYLHNVGLPGFAQRAVVRALAERGLVLETSRIHLAWFKNIEADNVALQPVGAQPVPRIECRRLGLQFDPRALLGLRMAPRELGIEDGRLILPWRQAGGAVEDLTVTNLQALIRFTQAGTWHLDSLEGETSGCRLSASGTVANAALIQNWQILERRPATNSLPVREMWETAAKVLHDVHLPTPARLSVRFDVDGAEPEKLTLSFLLAVDAVQLPNGRIENPELSVTIRPEGNEVNSLIRLGLQMDHLECDVARADYLNLSAAMSCLPERGCISAGRASFSAQRIDTLWAGGTDLRGALGWASDGTNLVPATGELDLTAVQLSTEQGLAETVHLEGRLSPSTGDLGPPLASRGLPWSLMEPFDLSAKLAAERVATAYARATNVTLDAHWSAPEVNISNLALDWADGHLAADVGLNLSSGRLKTRLISDFDPLQFREVLPRDAAVWLDQFTWQKPPSVEGKLEVVIPRRNETTLLWPGDLRPSLCLDGAFQVGAGTFKGVPLSGAESHFTYSNMCWHLPEMTVKRPDGILRVEHRSDERTHEFVWRVDGAVDPTPAFTLVPETAVEAHEVLGTLKFGGPPEVHLNAVGRHGDLASVEAWGTVRATNFSFRGREFESLETQVRATNLTLTVLQPSVFALGRNATASSIVFDFNRGLVGISNGVSHIDPMTIATVIGSNVIRAIEPYRFGEPPEGHVEGVVPLKGVAGTDMFFDLKGGPFNWQNFNLDFIQGRVHWREETVELSGVEADFYGGVARGDAFFDFTGKRDADFRFNVGVDAADIQPLVMDVFRSTNRLEGRLNGILTVTQGDTGDFGSWFGYGNARLEDGYLWSVPIFGIVSPLLDLFLPGLGNSRAKEAEGTYAITNSVIRTEDLVIHTSNMRLLYAGTIDFQGKVDAVAEAEILRDTVLVGELVSTLLTPLSKAMVIEIGGTLNEPDARPLYLVPRILLAPLNPLKLFRGLFAPREPEDQEGLPADPTGTPSPFP